MSLSTLFSRSLSFAFFIYSSMLMLIHIFIFKKRKVEGAGLCINGNHSGINATLMERSELPSISTSELCRNQMKEVRDGQ